MSVNNIFKNISDSLPDEVFETIIKTEDIQIERIVSYGHITEKDKWYEQNKNEWVIILKGKASIRFENESLHELNVGDYINIPAHIKHRVEWTEEDSKTIWLAVHY
jgi:cupin 2 domain-containing protein